MLDHMVEGMDLVIVVTWILILTFVSPRHIRLVETYEANPTTPVSTRQLQIVPFLTTWDGSPGSSTHLEAGQVLSSSPSFGFMFNSDLGSTKLMVRNLSTNVDVWSVTFPGEAHKVTLGQGTFIVENSRGQVLWSSPAPTGQNNGSPYYLKVGHDGVLRVTDKSGVAIFSTPPMNESKPTTITVAPVGASIGIATPEPKRIPQPNYDPLLLTTAQTPPKNPPTGILLGPEFMFPAGKYGLPRIFSEPE